MEDRERRGYKRVAVDLLCTVVMPNGSWHTATARNLSEGGIFLECDRPLTKGERVKVRLNLPLSGRLHKLEVQTEVMHGPSRISASVYGAGIRFEEVIDADAREGLLRFLETRPALA